MFKIGDRVEFRTILECTDDKLSNDHLWDKGTIIDYINGQPQVKFDNGGIHSMYEGELEYTQEQKITNAAEEIAELVNEKHKSYGGASDKTGQMLTLLYPDGIKKEQYDELNYIVRILDKLGRIASGNKDTFDENPWTDLVGYALRAKVKEDERREI